MLNTILLTLAKSIDYDVLSSAKNKELETNEKWGLAEESEYFANKVKLYRQDKLMQMNLDVLDFKTVRMALD